jgi:hypothetical protein
MTSHVYITINLFNLCQQSFLPFYIYFLKCWHRLNEPIKLPKSNPTHPPHPLPLVGSGYRLSHFWLAKEINIEVKSSAYKNHKIL